MRAGVAGLIPAPDQLAAQVRIYELFRRGTADAVADAESIHRDILPLIVFMIRSIGQALCYGKRFYGRQIGIEVAYDREPAQAPTAFGLAEAERLYARYLDTLRRLPPSA